MCVVMIEKYDLISKMVQRSVQYMVLVCTLLSGMQEEVPRDEHFFNSFKEEKKPCCKELLRQNISNLCNKVYFCGILGIVSGGYSWYAFNKKKRVCVFTFSVSVLSSLIVLFFSGKKRKLGCLLQTLERDGETNPGVVCVAPMDEAIFKERILALNNDDKFPKILGDVILCENFNKDALKKGAEKNTFYLLLQAFFNPEKNTSEKPAATPRGEEGRSDQLLKLKDSVDDAYVCIEKSFLSALIYRFFKKRKILFADIAGQIMLYELEIEWSFGPQDVMGDLLTFVDKVCIEYLKAIGKETREFDFKEAIENILRKIYDNEPKV